MISGPGSKVKARARQGAVAGGFAVVLIALTLGVMLAASLSVKPAQGPRDDGADNQTQVTLSGDLYDGGTATWGPPHIYWDVPVGERSDPDADDEIISAPGGAAINSDGTFSFSVKIPLYDKNVNPVRPGAHTLTVCGDAFGAAGLPPSCVTNGFQVLKGTADLNRTTGRPGDSVTVFGARWVPGNAREAIRMVWAPSGANLNLFEQVTGSSGWTANFVVPNAPAGTYVLRICNVSKLTDNCVAADTLNKQFTIVPPNLLLNKPSGSSGTSFTSSGNAFLPSRELHLFFGPQGKPLSDPSVHEISPGVAKSTNTDGIFGPYSYIPTDPPGNYTVTACTFIRIGCNPNDTATRPYTITAPTPSPTASPTAPPTASPTPKPTASPTASSTGLPQTPTPIISALPSLSAAPSGSESPTPTESALATPGPTAEPVTPAPTLPSTPEATRSESPTPVPTVAQSPTPQPVVVTWPEHLGGPGDDLSAITDIGVVGTAGLLALLIAFLAPFPGTLFQQDRGSQLCRNPGLGRRSSQPLERFA